MPLSGYTRIDNVIDSYIVGSIDYLPGRVKKGEEVEASYKLTSYKDDLVRVKTSIKSRERTLKENLQDKVKLEAGKSFIGSIKEKIEKEGL